MNKSEKRIYHIWNGMIGRCTHPSYPSYERYGAKGISVCQEWMTFENFEKWALKNGYEKTLSLDRLDNEKDYSPDNCRWSTFKEQENNRSNNRKLVYRGQEKTVSEWAEALGVNVATLFTRLKRGWSTERLLETPIRAK